MTTPMLDQEKVQAFAGKLLSVYTGAAVCQLIDIGGRAGLMGSAVAGGTSVEIAARAQCDERYVREWLAAMTYAGIVDYDEQGRTFSMPEERAFLLRPGSPRNMSSLSTLLDGLVRLHPELAARVRSGGGVSEGSFWPEFGAGLDGLWAGIYDAQLVEGFLGVERRLLDKLEHGCRIADVGCGTGRAIRVMAKRFPTCEFVGFDTSTEAIASAVSAAREERLSNAHFEILDIAQLPVEPGFDVITAFDVIHDLPDPFGVLRRIRDSLRPDGVFFAVELKFSSHIEKNVANPFAALYGAISLMHCTPVSLCDGGAGLGMMWGVESTSEALAASGFDEVEIHDSPRPQNCVYICRSRRSQPNGPSGC